MRYTILDSQNKIVNIVEWDGIAKWLPPAGMAVRPSQSGDTLIFEPVKPSLEDVLIAKGVITKADLDTSAATVPKL